MVQRPGRTDDLVEARIPRDLGIRRSRSRRPGPRPDRRRCGWRPPGRRPRSPPRRAPGRCAVRGSRGRRTPCVAWGSVAQRHRPWWPAAGRGPRCVRWCGYRRARSGPLRSVRSLRLRSVAPSLAGQTREPDPRRRRHERPQAARTRQTGTGPSVISSSLCAWPFTPKISPMAPLRPEPRRPTPEPHHSPGLLRPRAVRMVGQPCRGHDPGFQRMAARWDMDIDRRAAPRRRQSHSHGP